jgi:hypothetical protein
VRAAHGARGVGTRVGYERLSAGGVRHRGECSSGGRKDAEGAEWKTRRARRKKKKREIGWRRGVTAAAEEEEESRKGEGMGILCPFFLSALTL